MQQEQINNLEILQFELLKVKSLCHFSTTRRGGVSEGNYESLNMGNLSDDFPENVYENRKRLTKAIGAEANNLFVPHQTHSSNICLIDQMFLSLPPEEQQARLRDVDALITNQPDIAIGVTTADCVPVLLFDPVRNVLAAIHAGWKGTAAHIAAQTVHVMQQAFASAPKDIVAGIGPSISPEKFEVGDEVGNAFSEAGYDLAHILFRNEETGKLHIDLWEANRLQLIEAGVIAANIEVAGLCTYSDADRFFSARRQSIHSGRMLTGGMILSAE
ncbi:peptidoglycan editing factor PgeF [Dysgonomonas sp. 25]|uniref:peptidoglycan editing factor PgeF n=1 Tax=Dysgonomonas sp. 25 TaxID=2302933 RepID=UPI0013D0BA49|nr:peptidoglycan editing factor PgeF [Dysgonomonas sp. 25]NDV69372.1 peptidoglycan editing factor PgeF [Dysgonomonas sp. 25]